MAKGPSWSWSHGSWIYNYLYIYMQSVPITTNFVNSNPVHGKVYSMQHDVIKFVSDLWQVSGLLRELQFPPPIKLIIRLSIKNESWKGHRWQFNNWSLVYESQYKMCLCQCNT